MISWTLKPTQSWDLQKKGVSYSRGYSRVKVYEGPDTETGTLLFSFKRCINFTHLRVNIFSAKDEILGWFKSKYFIIGVEFRVFDKFGKEVSLVIGNWKGRNFRFLDSENHIIGTVRKKWAGIGKELFTTADNYLININGKPGKDLLLLLLAAGLSIDIIYR